MQAGEAPETGQGGWEERQLEGPGPEGGYPGPRCTGSDQHGGG